MAGRGRGKDDRKQNTLTPLSYKVLFLHLLTENYEHGEEYDGPELRDGHLGQGVRERYEHQAGTVRHNRLQQQQQSPQLFLGNSLAVINCTIVEDLTPVSSNFHHGVN
jgi:hypothetical protein